MPPFMAILGVLALIIAPVIASVWVGGVSDTEARFRVRGHHGYFAMSKVSTTNEPVNFGSPALITELATFFPPTAVNATGLAPRTLYAYGISSTIDPLPQSVTTLGHFRTFPTRDAPANISFAFASCAVRPSPDIYHRIRDLHQSEELALFIQTGDLFYGDIPVNDDSRFDDEYADVLDSEAARAVFSAMPVAYVFDDHDFGPNDADGTSSSAPAALRSYRRHVPHYPLPAEAQAQAQAAAEAERPVYQAWTVGRVRFIMSDLLTECRANGSNSLMSPTQTAWLRAELAQARNYAIVVWITSKPWIGANPKSAVSWLGHASERRALADFIASQNITNLVAISGDAHMLAIDDGTNSDYSTNGGAGFPLMQAAPLYKSGNPKGGPYTHGCFGYRLTMIQQFGHMRITDPGPGSPACFTWTGYRDSDALVTYSACAPFVKRGVPGGGQDEACSMPIMPGSLWALTVLACLAWLAGVTVLVLARRVLTKSGLALASVLLVLLLAISLLIIALPLKYFPENLVPGLVVLLVTGIVFTLLLLGLWRWHARGGWRTRRIPLVRIPDPASAEGFDSVPVSALSASPRP